MMRRIALMARRHGTAAFIQIGHALFEVRRFRRVSHGLATLLVLRETPIRREGRAACKKNDREGSNYEERL